MLLLFWEGVLCRTRNAKSCQGVICSKFDADFFFGMKGKVQNESICMSWIGTFAKYSPQIRDT